MLRISHFKTDGILILPANLIAVIHIKKTHFPNPEESPGINASFLIAQNPKCNIIRTFIFSPKLNSRKSSFAYGEIRNADHLHFMLHPSLACPPLPLFAAFLLTLSYFSPGCLEIFEAHFLGRAASFGFE